VVCLSVYHSLVLCKNSWTDKDAVCVKNSGGHKEPCIRFGPDPHVKGQFWGGIRYLHGKWLAETVSTTEHEFWRKAGPSVFQLQLLTSDKIWRSYLVINCVSLRTFSTPLIWWFASRVFKEFIDTNEFFVLQSNWPLLHNRHWFDWSVTAPMHDSSSTTVLLHFAWVIDDAKCIVVTRVCLSVCLSVAICPHYCTDPEVTWGHGRGCPLVVHYWVDLQSVHGLRAMAT